MFASVGNFDRAGASYSREQLAQQGLTPGARFTVSGLTATWPSAGVGSPDAVQPSGQTVTVSGQPARLRLVGSSRNGGSTGSVGVVYDNGTQSWFTVGLPDWVLPSATNPLPDGAVQVAMMGSRNKGNGNAGAYVFGTSEIAAPAGRTIKSILLPLQGQVRIFAIASDATQ